MTKKKRSFSLLGWWLIIVVIVLTAILVYPTVFRATLNKAHKESDQRVMHYQAAIERCLNNKKGKLCRCNAGQAGIPPVYTSWFGTIKSIHVYRGVIQVHAKVDLGQPVFIYYIPRQVQRRWFSSTTKPGRSVTWQRVQSSYCGLDNATYSCRHFMHD